MSSPIQIDMDHVIRTYIDAYMALPINHSIAKEVCSQNSYPDSIETLSKIFEMGLKTAIEKSIQQNMHIIEAKSKKFIHQYFDSVYNKEIMDLADGISSNAHITKNNLVVSKDIISPDCLSTMKTL